mgnify:CR=1 FL=1
MKKFIYGKNSEVLKLREWYFEGVECENFTSRTSAEDAAKYLLAHATQFDSCQNGDYMLSVCPLKNLDYYPNCKKYWIKMSNSESIIAAFFEERVDGWDMRAILDSISLTIN